MKKNNITPDTLVKEHPELFKYAYPLIGAGWLSILDTLCSVIKHHIKWEVEKGMTIVPDGKQPPEEGEWMPQFFFSQLKEKFGTGRFYYYGGDDYIKGAVEFAEAITAHTCEECGNRGEKKPTSWIKTLCDECFESYEQIRQERWSKWENEREQ